jgi:prepilin-type N-terminal cleavage/methylation domain-containing protein
MPRPTIFSRTARSGSTGFTLVELLVTVAIIGILASLLFPQVGKVMDRAAMAQSTNNLRQIGIAISGYVADNNGSLPNRKYGDPESWLNQAYARLYNKPWPGYVPSETGANLRGTVFFSPMLKSSEPGPWRSYGWNACLQDLGDGSPAQEKPPSRVVGLARPSKLILCGDSRNGSVIQPWTVQFRNEGKAFMLMADYHVQLFEPEELPASPTNPMWAP